MSIDDPDLTLDQMFRRWPATGGVFLQRRMFCFGCPIAPFHTVVDACAEYRLDEVEFRGALRAAARSGEK
ncbi:hypothetical protein FAZ78_21185 [Cereibacter changlensis]|uniref:Hybrid cluster-associated redox disulfide protein n=1 Tax=Cereibacter changlensis TaxID=402884 RepID=A0A4U0YQB8_9RHOB|nr:DUF1858 domain-containing protein [Cereibacter changlensis]TKA94652.1 hypothetical protein FAZ78_21185 [Cereibacter changlensis]